MRTSALSSPDKILIITHVFPPAGGIPVQRPLSFAKYLPDHGYEVHVLTARNAAAPVMDPGLLRHVPAAVTVHRTFTPEVPFSIRKLAWRFISPAPMVSSGTVPAKAKADGPTWKSRLAASARKVFTPDPEVVWVPFAIRQASKIIRHHGIGTVLVTAPPFSVFITGNALKRRFPDLSIVADFRDEWLTFYLSTFDFHSSPHIRQRAAAIERETVESADLVVTVTPSIVDEIRTRYPEQQEGKFVCLPNGYDPEAFAGFKPRPHGTGRILVTYVGTVYKASSPRYYLDAVDALPPEIRNRFETRFIGRIAEEEKPYVESRKSDVKVLGFMPQAQALKQMEETDFLLLTMTDASSLTGKLFEYLATGKPILAFAPSGGEISKILEETGAGWCVDPGEAGAARELLIKACEWVGQQDGWFRPDAQAIRRYERPALTGRLAELMLMRRGQASSQLA